MITLPTETQQTDAAQHADDERWAAVSGRDPAADGAFVYAVRTTGIYCRPTCPARRPLRANVEFHSTASAAAQAGFRPCQRCRPDAPSPITQRTALIAHLCRQIESAAAPLSLKALARQAAMSPSHLHRLFKSIVGVTPKAYASAYRAERLRSSLGEAPNVTVAIHANCYGSHSAFYADTHRSLGMTPSRYRRGGRDETIRFAFSDSWLGWVLLAATARGICAILLGEQQNLLLAELRNRFPHAQLEAADANLQHHLASVIRVIGSPAHRHDLALDIRGTAFQRRVWQALLQVPGGSTISYAQLARQIGAPKAARAVGSACAANIIAVAIPCHRALRSDGNYSSYRWGIERKRALVAKERHPTAEQAAMAVPRGELASSSVAAAGTGHARSSRLASDCRSLPERPFMLPGTDAANASEPILRPAPYVNRFVSVAGLRLHYLDYGTAANPPMLCIHGGAAHAHWYDFIADRFTRDYHVRALDLRGHGDSDWGDPHGYSYQRYADDVFEAVDRLELKDFVLMGHSMGGLVSLLYAATHPEQVKKLVIVDTALNMTEERVASMRIAGNREGRSYATHEEFQTRFRLQPPKSKASPEVVAHIARHSGREFPDNMWRHKVDRNVQAWRASMNGIPLWAHIRIPALLVKGGLSDRITSDIGTQVRHYCPHVQFAEVPGAEHHVTLDNPAGFVRAISAFLASR